MAHAVVFISDCKHLQAAAIDVLLEELHPYPEPTSSGTRYIVALLQAFWAEASVQEIVQDIRTLFPRNCVLTIAAFCHHSYPELLPLFE